MKIVFSALKTNLANTGGCRTIVKSCHVLRAMGHECDIVAAKNRYTWEKVKVLPAVPACDICIAISVLDIDTVRKAKAKHKLLWLRGPEWWWLMDEERALAKIKSIRTLCNSTWLRDHLYARGVASHVCYSGMDMDYWSYNDNPGRTATIGCLYSERKTKMWKDFAKLAVILGSRFKYVSYGITDCRDTFISEHLCSPAPAELRALYNKCRYWFAPSIMEGFHNPPAEAAFCGCVPVVTHNPHGGTLDYVVDNKHGIRYVNLEHAVESIRQIDENEFARRTCWQNARARLYEIGSRKAAMEQMLDKITNGVCV
jgi:glycosyltransferase involved in cell wall biosynthesis